MFFIPASDDSAWGRSQELIEGRQRLVKEFTEYRDRCIELWKEQKPRRLQLRDGESRLPATSWQGRQNSFDGIVTVYSASLCAALDQVTLCL